MKPHSVTAVTNREINAKKCLLLPKTGLHLNYHLDPVQGPAGSRFREVLPLPRPVARLLILGGKNSFPPTSLLPRKIPTPPKNRRPLHGNLGRFSGGLKRNCIRAFLNWDRAFQTRAFGHCRSSAGMLFVLPGRDSGVLSFREPPGRVMPGRGDHRGF